MLGMEASRSMADDNGVATHEGACSERNMAKPSPTGTTMTIAAKVVTTVPTMRTPVPYWLAAGFHVPDQMKLGPKCANASADCPATVTTRPISRAANAAPPAQRSTA